MNYVALCDGFCTNNGKVGAQAGGSYVVYEIETPTPPDVTIIQQTQEPLLKDLRFTFKDVTTNNVAEATSLLVLLSALIENKILAPKNFVNILMDSELTINQVKGIYKITKPHLRAVHNRIQILITKYKADYGVRIWDSLKIRHISGDTMKMTAIGH